MKNPEHSHSMYEDKSFETFHVSNRFSLDTKKFRVQTFSDARIHIFLLISLFSGNNKVLSARHLFRQIKIFSA